MSSNSDVKTAEPTESSTDADLVNYLPVGANPETIRSVSKALERLQDVAQRSQFPMLVPAVASLPLEQAEVEQVADEKAVRKRTGTLTEYAMFQQVRGARARAGTERHASRLYNGAKSIW